MCPLRAGVFLKRRQQMVHSTGLSSFPGFPLVVDTRLVAVAVVVANVTLVVLTVPAAASSEGTKVSTKDDDSPSEEEEEAIEKHLAFLRVLLLGSLLFEIL